MNGHRIERNILMKHLTKAILADYDITLNAPARVCAVQFGDDALLLGLADRLLDDANVSGLNVGVCAVQCGDLGFAKELSGQDGLYTVLVRGEYDDKPVRREQVVQSVVRALNPVADDEALMALARSADIRFGIVHVDETGEFARRDRICTAIAARFMVERWREGLEGMAMIVCGEDVDCADSFAEALRDIARSWNAGEEFEAWLDGCRFFPALADCLVCRSSAEEAAKLCADMNYADAMIHIAEPYGQWIIQADTDFRTEFPMDQMCPQIQFTDDLSAHLLKKQRLFDAGLFAIAALGCLHGNLTLSECMQDEPLRDFVGHAMQDEILPYVPFTREELIPYVIRCYERYGNPMNDNVILDCARGLIRRFVTGVLPVIRAYAAENFEPPKHLTVALAATILLYADVRFVNGAYETVVGQTVCTVHDAPRVLDAFGRLASDMSPDSLAYAVLSDRTLWNGEDLREIDGLLEKVTENLAG